MTEAQIILLGGITFGVVAASILRRLMLGFWTWDYLAGYAAQKRREAEGAKIIA